MPGLLIREVSPKLHKKLKARAAAHRRSLGREALVLLEQALEDPAGPPTLEQIDDMRVRGTKPLTQDLIDRARKTGRP